MNRGIGYEGRLAGALLGMFQHFVVSVLFMLCALPFMVYQSLVGWQPTHLAVWLGVLSLLPVGPGVFATLVSMREFLVRRGYTARPVRGFTAAFGRAVRELGWWWLGCATLELLLSYDGALFGRSDTVFGAVAVGFLALAATTIGICCAVLGGVRGRPVAVLTTTLLTMARRPHVVATWLFVFAGAALVTRIPLLGTSLALFLPAVCASCVLVVNAAHGFDRSLVAADGRADAPVQDIALEVPSGSRCPGPAPLGPEGHTGRPAVP
ncbi:hypothetical protein, partial [Streptomyces shenzhenensis]|uniref:hypothetical protein n=1 Tax=Streptomyces shenzhenensis TaxID=943815 RepID=UPI0015F09C85